MNKKLSTPSPNLITAPHTREFSIVIDETLQTQKHLATVQETCCIGNE